ncbi:MAG TPA: ABC transporter ATP-binding protein [Firmicutes bacterium]|nr:ABC transporter ATP-binding protein [Candidatus Fermentithermobacillaceae bacterium]
MVRAHKEEVLSVEGLEVVYKTERGPVRAVRGVDLSVREGEILGLVGESGCGKSATLLSIMGLLPPTGRIVAGKIRVGGVDVMALSKKELRSLRGNTVAMVFQDPMSSLNPAHKIGAQMREALEVHGQPYSKDILVRLLQEVGIPSPETVLGYYPHQLSGGMQQRVMIAIALSCRPRLILADEPTTALDVTIEAQILDLLRQINRERGTAIVLVTHNLAVASQFCDRIAVMYAGQIVEEGNVNEVLSNPLHPYTQGLIGCIPRFQKGVPLTPIPGQVADLSEDFVGCAFYPRCRKRDASCATSPQELVHTGTRRVRCHRYGYVEYTETVAGQDWGNE